MLSIRFSVTVLFIYVTKKPSNALTYASKITV